MAARRWLASLLRCQARIACSMCFVVSRKR
jgi:hypothetical protein